MFIREAWPLPLDAPVHDLAPGDFVLVRTWKDTLLQFRYKGPFQILLTSFTTAKLEGVKSWIHYSCLKKVDSPENLAWTVTKSSEKDSDRKLLFKKQ